MTTFRLASPSASSVSTRAPHDYPPSPATPTFSDRGYDSSSSEDNLPYPTELQRADFLAEPFDAQTYLSSLRNRHQTLEDLRSELRARSQLLNRELLELVNGQYEAFLSLGGDLRGGEEKVESVRVGVLGFEREVVSLCAAVKEREQEVGELLGEKEAIRKDVVLGRALLEVEGKVGELEGKMGVSETGVDVDEEEQDDDEDLEGDEDDDGSTAAWGGISIRKLQRHASDFALIVRMMERLGASHPFIISLQPRLDKLRSTLLLDLTSALRQARTAKAPDIIEIVKLYSEIGAESEGLKVLKGG